MKIPMKKKNFQTILEFYLFNCPVAKDIGGKKKAQKGKKVKKQKVSKLARTFEERGIEGGRLSELLRDMKKSGVTKKIEYGKAVSEDDIDKHIKEWDKKNRDAQYEYICVYDSSRIGITKAVFYCIRNSLAHGSFEIHDDVYILKSDRDGKKRGDIRVKENTLLNWIKLVENATK